MVTAANQNVLQLGDGQSKLFGQVFPSLISLIVAHEQGFIMNYELARPLIDIRKTSVCGIMTFQRTVIAPSSGMLRIISILFMLH